MPENLLVTKLYVPAQAASTLPRPQLFSLLDEGPRTGRRLTLISAPAGYGKTTLIAEWIQQRKLPAAWLSLDAGDNDPARFFAYLTAAIQTARPEIEEPRPFLLSAGESLEPALVSLLNTLASRPSELLIVLDDYHMLQTQAIHDALTFFVESLPPNIHLVLATRADPPLPLPRWRARGQLLELRMSDLRFSAEESAAFLRQALDIPLTLEEISALDSRTEGWAVGLQLAALALQAQTRNQAGQEASGFIRHFSGSNRYILDYLVEEVLQRQPEVVQRFLLQTSILERMCRSLAAAVTGLEEVRPDGSQPFAALQPSPSAEQILEHLDRSNLFVIPLDDRREWYRYHRLFADLLSRR